MLKLSPGTRIQLWGTQTSNLSEPKVVGVARTQFLDWSRKCTSEMLLAFGPFFPGEAAPSIGHLCRKYFATSSGTVLEPQRSPVWCGESPVGHFTTLCSQLFWVTEYVTRGMNPMTTGRHLIVTLQQTPWSVLRPNTEKLYSKSIDGGIGEQGVSVWVQSGDKPRSNLNKGNLLCEEISELWQSSSKLERELSSILQGWGFVPARKDPFRRGAHPKTGTHILWEHRCLQLGCLGQS